MRPCLQAMFVAMFLSAPLSAGFEIRLESKDLQANQGNQTIDIFLKSTFDAQVRSLRIAAFIGSSSDAINFGGVQPDQYRDDEGNFEDVGVGGVQFLDIDGPPLEYFWDQGYTSVTSIGRSEWGWNTVQAEIQFVTNRHDPSSVDYRSLSSGEEVKVGTFHIDTTDVLAPSLNISLYDENNDLQYTKDGTTYTFAVTSVATTGGEYAISDPDSLEIVGSTTFNITSTPEPAVIGIAGLSLTAGLGWLGARNRRRKSPQ